MDHKNRPTLKGLVFFISAVLVGALIATPSAYAGTFDGGVATSIIDIQAPLYDTDDLPLEDLNYITLHWGGSPGTYVGSLDIVMAAGETREETLNINWDPGVNQGSFIIYVAATATDYSGNVSTYSNELALQFEIEDTVAPAPPVLNSLDIVVTTPYGKRYRVAAVDIPKLNNRLTKREGDKTSPVVPNREYPWAPWKHVFHR